MYATLRALLQREAPAEVWLDSFWAHPRGSAKGKQGECNRDAARGVQPGVASQFPALLPVLVGRENVLWVCMLLRRK